MWEATIRATDGVAFRVFALEIVYECYIYKWTVFALIQLSY